MCRAFSCNRQVWGVTYGLPNLFTFDDTRIFVHSNNEQHQKNEMWTFRGIQQNKEAFNLIAQKIKDDEDKFIEIWYARELQKVLALRDGKTSLLQLAGP